MFCAPRRVLDCRHDLEAIDFALVQSLTSIRDIHIGGLETEEAFRDIGLGGFEVVTADGRRVDLPTPGGASREVTRENRLEFADMVEAFKKREYRVPVSKTGDFLVAVQQHTGLYLEIDHPQMSVTSTLFFTWN